MRPLYHSLPDNVFNKEGELTAFLLTGVQQHIQKEETEQLGTEEITPYDNKHVDMVLTEQNFVRILRIIALTAVRRE